MGTSLDEWKRIQAARDAIHWRQRILLKEALNRILQDQSIIPRDKILLQMRANDESRRRSNEHARSSYVPASISYQLDCPIYDHIALKCAMSCPNVSTALYIFDKKQQFPYVGAMEIESWLWRQWFKPYVSDITLHSFSSIFAVEYDPNLSDVEFNSEKLVALHCNHYEQAQRMNDIIADGENDESKPTFYGPLRTAPWQWDKYDVRKGPFSRRAAYIVLPLFRALFIVLFYPQANINRRRTPEEVRALKVQLVLTGITDGLSAHISFEELRDEALEGSYHSGATTLTTTLDSAFRFIMRLEEREIAASGGVSQPDVTKLHGWDFHQKEAKKLGWIEERDGKLDDLSPRSCEWVNRDIFKKWVGKGAEKTLDFAMDPFSQLNPFKDSEENWWWDREMLPEEPGKEKPYTQTD